MKFEEVEELFESSRTGNFERVISILSHGININSNDISKKTALHYSCEFGHLNIVEYLINNGAKIISGD